MYLGSRVKAGGRSKVGGDLSPISLFLTGAQGVWFDRQDLSSMYQDAAGTVPAAVNSPVGKCLDKSGRGNHATQGTAASRPILRQDASGRYYLEYDGVDDGMATAAIDFSTTDKVTAFAGVYKASDAAGGVVLELSASDAANNGAFHLQAPNGAAAATYAWFSKGTVLAGSGSAASYAAPIANVLAGIGDIAGDTCTLRVNGTAYPSATDQGLGSYGNYPLYIGRRGGTTLPFNGRDYGLLVVGRALSATEIARAERFLASRMGIAI